MIYQSLLFKITYSFVILVWDRPSVAVHCFVHKRSWIHFSTSGHAVKCIESTGWFKTMDSILYVYISWIIQGMWMMYITFESGGPNFLNTISRMLQRSSSAQLCSSVSWEQNGYYAAQDFCVREFIKTAVQRAFRLRFNIQPPTRRAFVAGITNSNFEIQTYENESIFLNYPVH